mmetsp:Transcript_10673/g.24903  ORF Transcript_10673/g.24903 Transcript_10673/m.24903 type:complete len:208 (+) Transcript_10673:2722-3345(+)
MLELTGAQLQDPGGRPAPLAAHRGQDHPRHCDHHRPRRRPRLPRALQGGAGETPRGAQERVREPGRARLRLLRAAASCQDPSTGHRPVCARGTGRQARQGRATRRRFPSRRGGRGGRGGPVELDGLGQGGRDGRPDPQGACGPLHRRVRPRANHAQPRREHPLQLFSEQEENQRAHAHETHRGWNPPKKKIKRGGGILFLPRRSVLP